MSATPQRVLVVRTGAIGDVVNALALASALVEAWPGARVGWVVHDLARPLVEGHPDVARVHRWDRRGALGELRRLLGELRAERYELALDLQRLAKSALVARLSGAPRVVGFDRARTKELSWLLTRERLARPEGDPRARHMLDGYLDFARHLGIERPAVLHRFPDDPQAERAAERLVAALGAEPVVVATGASKPQNRWLPERFARLAPALAEELGRPVLLTGAAGERAQLEPAWRAAGFAPQPAEELLAAAARAPARPPGRPSPRGDGRAPVVDLVGRTDLRELSSLLARAALFVGCDSGPMHLAAARGLPVVALFGPADPRRTGPWGGERAGHRVVRAPATGGAGRRRMEDIGVEDVLEAVRASVRARAGAGTLGP